MSKISLSLALAFAAAVTSFAQAQTTQPAKPTTINVDGKAAAGMTVDGKTYVSVDALKTAGLNVQNSKIFLLTNPKAGQPAYKLSGCINEWLWNGATRMRINSVSLLDADPRFPKKWFIYYSLQPVIPSASNYYDGNIDIAVDFSAGDKVLFNNPAWVYFTARFSSGAQNELSIGAVTTYRSDAESPADPPVKLSLPQIRASGATYPAMTFDLTCKK